MLKIDQNFFYPDITTHTPIVFSTTLLDLSLFFYFVLYYNYSIAVKDV
jgi:hypothetical protein